MKKRIVTLLLFSSILFGFHSYNLQAQPGKDGNLTVSSLGQVVNRYTRVTSNIVAGATTISVNNIAVDLGSLATGDLIMVYQAQGASIQTTNDNNYGAITSYNSAGLYEYIYVNSVAGNVITVSCGLKNSYLVSGKVQVIKVPLYNNLTINSGASIAARTWDGNTGGILAVHVRGILTNNGVIDVVGKGFRGGKRDNSSQASGVAFTSYISTLQADGAEKGESIAGFGPEYDLLGGRFCRGAPANGGGGGNTHNHGGGGGANGDNGRPWTGAGVMDPNPAYLAAWMLDPDYIANGNALTNSSGGGRGGYSYSARDSNALVYGPDLATWGGNNRHSYGARGGRPLKSEIETRVFFGGGGGAGDGNNSASNDGGDGGGIAYIIAKTFTGSGLIKADGLNGLNTVAAGNDAPGGGGGGGTIVVKANTINNQTLSANGGNGGNQIITTTEAEGCGGGGGGGVIATPPNGTGTCGITSTYIYISGRNGLTTSFALTEFLPNGGTWGANGQYDIKVSPGFIPFTITCLVDLDGDNIDDRTNDLDNDNDGILNTVEGYLGISGAADADADLIPNYSDPDFSPYIDINCDGINDIFDFDLDAVPDCIDLDSDNDGITDCIEAGGIDANGDGIYDGFTDLNGDGLDDRVGSGLTGTDMDGDGLNSQRDRDSDGDGITDCIEAGGTDATANGIIDAYSDNDDDGYSDNIDPKAGRLTFSGASTGISPLAVYDTDSDSKKDFVDIDADNDGISDNVESQPTAGYRPSVLQDTDHDGILNIYDDDNGGTKVALVNTDGSDLPDYRDTDSDNDGVADNIEANDANSDGNPIPALPASTADSDGDGLPNVYDGYSGLDVTIAGYGGTGSLSPVQDTDNDGIRDWRDIDDDGDCLNTSSTGAGNENANSNAVWNDDFDQNGAPIPNYLFAKNSFSVIGASRCGDGSVNLNATSVNSGNFNWYTVSTGGAAVFTQNGVTASVYSPSITATTNYYVDFTVDGCTSARKLVIATKIDNSFSPTVTPGSVCGSGAVTLSALTGSTGTFRWFDAATAGNLLKTDNNTASSSYTTPVISSTTTYYVEFDNGTCTGQRAPVVATISSGPSFTVADGYTCGTSSATLTATGPGNGTFNWYNAPSGGLLLRSQSGVSSDAYTATSISANTDFYVEFTDGCLAPRQKVTALVNTALTSPTATNGTSCGAGTVLLSATSSSSGSFRWYDAPVGGTLLQTDNGVSSTNFTTPSISADQSYYVSYSDTQCSSSRSVANAYVIDAGTIVAPNVSRCGTGTVFLTASSSVPGTFRWYSVALGGTALLTSSSGVTSSVYQTASIAAGSSSTYYLEFTTSSPTCTINPRKSIIASAAASPTITPSGTLSNGVYATTVCSAGVQTLTASSDQAGTFRWYDASSGGTLVFSETDNTPATYTTSFTTPYLSGSVDYYLEFDNGTCVTSSRQDVRLNIIGASEPTVTDNTRCATGTLVLGAISQIPSTFRWYSVPSGGSALRTSAGGLYSDSYTTPSISSTTTYYVEYTAGGCTSPRVPVVATVNSAPNAPTAINGSRCGGAGTVLIGASSSTTTNILWYSASSGGSPLFSENGVSISNFTTPSIAANATYYAETNNGTCASTTRTAVNAIVTTGTAVVPTTTGATNCGSGSFTLTANSASNGVFRWYDAASGGNLLKTEPAVSSSGYSTPVLSSSKNYYVDFDRGVAGACPTSSRVLSAVIINAVPSNPTVNNNSICGSGSVSLSANSGSTGDFLWYDALSGGNLLFTENAVNSSLFNTPVISTNTPYYVSFSNGSCSSTRIKADAVIYTVPSAPSVTNNSNCGPGSVSLSANSASSGNFLWFDNPGGNLLHTDNNTTSSTYNTPTISSNTSYYVYFDNGTCTSSQTVVTATINSTPNSPSAIGDSRCGVGSLNLNATSLASTTFRWYTANVGGALLQTDPGVLTSNFTTPPLSFSTTYYVESFDGTCASTRTPVDATINTCVTLSVDKASISEAVESAIFTVTLSSISSQDVIIDLSIGGTASGLDYTHGTTSITIPAGQLTGTLTVTSAEDLIYEGAAGETIVMDISNVTNGSEVGTQQQTVTINENETAPTVSLSVNPASIGENGVSSTLTATLSVASSQDVTVTIGYTGTATGSGADYNSASASITIPAGQLSATTTVTSVEDVIYEGNESIIADIANVIGGDATENGTQQQTITITDNETAPVVTLTVSPLNIGENGVVSNLTATLSVASSENVTVTLSYSGNASGSGTDYNTATTITILAGQLSGTVTITSVEDLIYEGNETIIAEITNVSGGGASENGIQQQTVTISDNESAPTVTLGAGPLTIGENGAISTLTATLSVATTQDVTVTLGFTGSASGSGTDYNSSTTITILAGQLTGTTTVNSVDDIIYEGDESVIADITGVAGGSATENGTQQQTIIFIDDELPPTVTLSAIPLAIVENSGVSTLTATLSVASSQDVTVTIGYSGTASGSGTDYSASTTITILAGQLTGTTTITANEDLIYEGSESVIADITNVSGGGATENGTQQQTIAITDNETAPVVSLIANPISIGENGITSTLTASLSVATSQDVTITIGYTGTAIGSGTDYNAINTITILAGQISGSISVTSVEDVIYEGNETIIADITNVSGGGATENGIQQQTVAINDNETAPTVSLSASPLTIGENGGVSNITATLSVATTQDVTVTLNYTGTATGLGTDYNAGSQTITILAGQLTGSITIISVDDAIYEANETVIVDITNVSGGGASENGTQQQTINITDNETAPIVSLSASPLAIGENGGISTLTATLSVATTQDVTVTLGFTGTATGSGTDYTSASATITIFAGNLAGTTTVTASDDALYEGNETIIADITNVSGGSATENGSQQQTITITDNETAPTVTLSANPASIGENGVTSTVTATLSVATTQNVTVTLGYTGTATGSGTDYNAASATITILAGQLTGTTSLTSVDDVVYESNETVIVDITNVSGGSATENGIQQQTITIADNETAPTVTLSANPLSIGESGISSILTASLSVATTQDVTVTIGYTGSATGSGTDYTAVSNTITILAGQLTGTTTITTDEDAIYEGNETLIADIINVSGGSATENGTQQQIISIIDNETAPVVTLSAGPATIGENGVTSTLTASLSVASFQNVIVTIGYTGTATGSGTDYSAASATITILAGQLTGTTTIISVEDLIYEGNETIIADITNVTGGGASESGAQQQTITITDNESLPTVSLVANPASIGESGVVSTITASLSVASYQDVTVTLGYTGAATGTGTDYNAASQTITILAGQLTGSTTITSVDDAIYEGNENVVVDITNVSGGSATENGTQQQTITINDNETAPNVSLSASPVAIGENGIVSTLIATLSVASFQNVVVSIGYTGTAADAGTDYNAASNTITIFAGNLTGTTTITSVDDAIYEGNETIIADITNVLGGGATENGEQQQSITINDNETAPTVSLIANPLSIGENAALSTLTASLSTATTQNVVVTIGFTGTANGSGTDYSVASNTITILAGNLSGSTTITSVDDAIYEGNETVVADIINVSGGSATENGSQQQTVTILDNESAPTVSLNASPASINENAGSTILTASLSVGTTQDVTVTIGYTGTATDGGIDYTAGSATITILGGQLTGTTTITSAADAIYEGNETIIADIINIAGGNATENGTQQEIITINDDETPPTVSLSAVPALINESNEVSILTATLSVLSSQNVIVTIDYTGTAAGSGVDYSAASTTITILAGQLTGSTTVTSVEDLIYEGTETIVADITNVSGGGAAENGTQQQIIDIIDNESAPTVSLSANPLSIGENGVTSIITATLSVATTQNVIVSLDFTGTAMGFGTDYSAASTIITILAGNLTGSSSATSVIDLIYEGNETVIVDITNVSGGGATENGTQQQIVNIIDNETAPTVTLSANPLSIAENGATSTITASLSGITSEDVTVTLGYSGTATGSGTDYNAASITITILAGQLAGTTTVSSVDDAIYEGDESIIVDIINVSGGGATENLSQQATINIIDDEQQSDLSITKTVNNINSTAGSNVIFTISVVNNGPSNATGVKVTDILPDGYTFVNAVESAGNWVSPEWNIGNLASGATENLQITAIVNASGNYTNSASVIGDQPDPIPGNDNNNVTLSSLADLVVTKTIDNPTPDVGSTVVFTISVNNNGPANATNVVVTDNLPGGYTFISANPTSGAWNSPNWTINNLTNGSSESIQITAIVNANGLYSNTATVISDQPDPVPGDESDIVTPVPVALSNLTVVKTVDNSVPNIGENVTFTITVTNDGPSDATGVVVTDNIPDGFTFISANPSAGTWTDPTWNVGNLANGATETIQIIAMVNVSGNYTNTASVKGDQPDPIPGGENDNITINPGLVSNLAMNKIVDNLTPAAGDNVTFTLTVVNNGPFDATGVKVSDNLPTGYTFISDDGNGAYSGGIWTIGNLTNGATISLKIIAKVNSSGIYANTATVSGDQNDPQSLDNSSTSTPVPDVLPVANDDLVNIDEDSGANSIMVLADNGNGGDDFALNGPSVGEISIISTSTQGTAAVNNNGTPNNPTDDYVVYTPNPDYHGNDSFTYQICDFDGDCASATVSITVNSVNDVPVANDDNVVVNEDGILNGSVSGNDVGLGDSPVTCSLATNAGHGVLVFNSDGTFIYTPAADYFGNDNFTYTVCDADNNCSTATVNITVNPVNDIPAAVDDISSVEKDKTLNGSVSGNDSGLGDGPLNFSKTSDVTNGSLTFNADGTYTYIPNAGYTGNDGFTYTVCDADGECSSAMVSINVILPDNLPVAVNDDLNIDEDNALNGDVSANDTGLGDSPIIYNLEADASHGTLIFNANGTFSYLPYENYNGDDSFAYKVCDADGDCATATVNITVNPVNDSPVANPDNLTIGKNDGSGSVNAANNDTDIDNNLDPGSIVLIGNSGNGATVTVDGSGSITYTPAEGFFGLDTVIYQIFDTDGLSDIDTLFVTVEGEINVPNSFSPNNDNINDKLIIPGIDDVDNEIFIYNRWGNEVFHAVNYRNDVNAWDGRAQNKTKFGGDEILPVGTYFYILYIKGKNKPLKGYVYLQY